MDHDGNFCPTFREIFGTGRCQLRPSTATISESDTAHPTFHEKYQGRVSLENDLVRLSFFTRRRTEINSSELLRNSGARPPFPKLDIVSDENSRGKLQNVVVNSTAVFRSASIVRSLPLLSLFAGRVVVRLHPRRADVGPLHVTSVQFGRRRTRDVADATDSAKAVKCPILRPALACCLPYRCSLTWGMAAIASQRGGWSCHRSPSRLAIAAGQCWRAEPSGKPQIARTCCSN